jgi:hypothetical protein
LLAVDKQHNYSETMEDSHPMLEGCSAHIQKRICRSV